MDTIHYEILVRSGRKWTILGVHQNRQDATKTAEAAWATGKYQGLRVLKESFNAIENEFTSLEILSRGATRKPSKYDESGTLSPCLTPDDLYTNQGRQSIWELLGNTLGEWAITPTELLHNLEHYYKLYNTGTRLQNAVQRTAVSYENDNDTIQERMRKLFKVIEIAVEIVESTKADVPSLEEGRLRPIIARLEEKSNKKFLLTCAIVEYLRPAVTLADKLGRTTIFLTTKNPGWVTEILDQLISEFLLHSKLTVQLIYHEGGNDRGELMSNLCYFMTGQFSHERAESVDSLYIEELEHISSFLENGMLPICTRVLHTRLTQELEASTPINAKGIHGQLRALGDLLQTVEKLKVDLINPDDTVEDRIISRAARLINNYSVTELLNKYDAPYDKLYALLDLEEFAIGEGAKRVIANFIFPILTQHDYEATFIGLGENPMPAMTALRQLQTRIDASGFSIMHKRKVSEKLDDFCRMILENSQILKKIHTMDVPVQEKVKKLLTLLADGYFTDGTCRQLAEQQTRTYMKQDGFTEGLIQNAPQGKQEEALLTFRELLARAKIA